MKREIKAHFETWRGQNETESQNGHLYPIEQDNCGLSLCE